MISDLYSALTSPDAIAFSVYSAGIISREKRDEIISYEQGSKKKTALLSAVESQIDQNATVYYEFLEILSRDASTHTICSKLREECGEYFVQKFLSAYNVPHGRRTRWGQEEKM